MSMLLLLSVGCSNLPVRDWAGGGSRYASGYASEEDTASDTGTPSTEGAPEIVEESCNYDVGEVEGQIFITCGLAVEDSNEDIVGGRVYFTLRGDGEVLLADTRGIVSENANANTQALYANEIVTFGGIGPVEDGVTHEIVVYVNDFTVNSSNETTVLVTGG